MAITEQEKEKRRAIIHLALMFQEFNLFKLTPDILQINHKQFIEDYKELARYFFTDDVLTPEIVRDKFCEFHRKYVASLTFLRDWLPRYAIPENSCNNLYNKNDRLFQESP